jgi:hypothetical protein
MRWTPSICSSIGNFVFISTSRNGKSAANDFHEVGKEFYVQYPKISSIPGTILKGNFIYGDLY